ncbi:flagellar hook-basal body protein [Effusibacillus dendaii]|uniref:Flagellar basal body protein n=1 Tax=Effusibacillus dendaii TaxID=2743772 RepID=A0A7I8DCD0_9BACL|nr:flagellar hook-basal body protein [Effusibacillus dendaii]BCJ87745.1 flagellar basal body protein [Effusibacillus dendaii]
MIRGLYTAASGMVAGERRQDVISNNLANVNTIGFKKDDSIMRSFPEMLLYSLNDHTGSGPQSISPGMPNIGSVGTGAFLEEVLTRFSQGPLKATDNKYGYAIEDVEHPGEPRRASFFPMEDAQGNSYVSRDGDFHLDTQGYLVNSAGFFVQAVDATGKPIPNSRVKFDEQSGSLVAGMAVGVGGFQLNTNLQFKIIDIQDTNQLQQAGTGSYRYNPASVATGTGELKKGFVETSNVDVAQAMTDMMAVMRSYEANQRMIRTLDSTLDKAVNSLGRI